MAENFQGRRGPHMKRIAGLYIAWLIAAGVSGLARFTRARSGD